MGTIPDSEDSGREGMELHRELLQALELARSRLAIAIAEETKRTPRDRRQYYLETAEYMRGFIVRLRRGPESERRDRPDWESALDALKRIPRNDAAFSLCRRLRNIVMELE